MTENEAIEILQEFKTDKPILEMIYGDCHEEALKIASKALEEIQQYRTIGTVEEIESYIRLSEKLNVCDLVGENAELENKITFLEAELNTYKKIGTVEFFEQLSEQFKPHTVDENSCKMRNCNRCDKYRKENKKYHSIGTVTKCKEAMEKQKAKSPHIWGDGYAGGQLVYDTYDCPNCGENYEIDYADYEYCPKCGQRIDRTDLERGG